MEPKPGNRRAPYLIALALSGLCLACQQEQVALELLEPPATPLRPVRVLIASRAGRIHLRADTPLVAVDDNGVTLREFPSNDGVLVSAGPEGLRFDDAAANAVQAEFRAGPEGPIRVAVNPDRAGVVGVDYPGVVRVVRGEGGLLEVINFVGVERYVACVVANEVWPTFETEAYRAQAIASRTFVLYQMERRNDASYDVSATQGSQVYRGIRADTAGGKAAEAARYTAGLACTCQVDGRDRLFCAYYSAACGGVSQSAAIFGPENAMPPLAGGVTCDYCKIAPGDTYRWGPVRLSKEELTSRLLAASPEFASLGRVQGIAVSERTSSGRPARLRIVGSSGETREVLAERFRLAVGGNLIRSTSFQLKETDRDVVFDDGRGFGHGLGLCQWGMQGQAKKGKSAGEILRYYYPGSELTRLY